MVVLKLPFSLSLFTFSQKRKRKRSIFFFFSEALTAPVKYFTRLEGFTPSPVLLRMFARRGASFVDALNRRRGKKKKKSECICVSGLCGFLPVPGSKVKHLKSWSPASRRLIGGQIYEFKKRNFNNEFTRRWAISVLLHSNCFASTLPHGLRN